MAKKKWTEKNIRDVASRCESPSDFQRKYPGGYVVASRLGLLSSLTYKRPRIPGEKIRLRPYPREWDELRVRWIAFRYSGPAELRLGNPRAWQAMRRLGLKPKQLMFSNKVTPEPRKRLKPEVPPCVRCAYPQTECICA